MFQKFYKFIALNYLDFKDTKFKGPNNAIKLEISKLGEEKFLRLIGNYPEARTQLGIISYSSVSIFVFVMGNTTEQMKETLNQLLTTREILARV